MKHTHHQHTGHVQQQHTHTRQRLGKTVQGYLSFGSRIWAFAHLGEIVRGHLNGDLVAREDLNVILADFPRNMSEDLDGSMV